MTLEEELTLSYYKKIADIEADHGIYLVQDIRTKKIYIQKILSVYNRKIYRYLRENPIAHTPRIRELVETQGHLIVIEDYIPGSTLQELLEESGPMKETAVIDIGIQLCRILESFHSCNPPIVNRDIKPSNIKFTEDGIVKLIDLNTAKLYSQNQEKDTRLLGTEGYAAPEQYGFGPSSVLTDVYSVGVLLHVLLTNALPGTHPVEGRLQSIIKKCTALSPENRYQSIASLRLTLEALLEPSRHDTFPETEPSSSYTKTKQSNSWRRFLPPGLRGKNPFLSLLALAVYLLWFNVCFSLEVKNAGATEVFLNRLTASLTSLAAILFSGNYLSIQDRLGFTRNQNPLLRLLIIVATDFLILCVGILLMNLLLIFIL